MTTPGPDTPESWGAAAREYSSKVAPVLMAAYVEEFADRLGVGPEHKVLEVAAGSGALTTVLAKRAGSVLATDFAPKMLEVLRENLEASDVKNVELAEMDGQALSLDDDSFDRAACCFGLMLFPDRARGFSELYRVVRPGGRAMVSGWAGPDKFEGFGIFMAAMKRALPDMPPPPAPPPVFNLADTDRFKAEMEAAGFKNVAIDHVSRDLQVEDFPAMWSMMTSGAPPIEMLFARIGPEGKDKVRDALAAIVEERFGSGPIRLTNVATVGCGDVPV